MQDITLTIKGYHSEDGEENNIEFITEGRLGYEEGSYVIEYDESEISGIKNTTTRLLVSDDCVRMARGGSIDTEFVFAQTRQFEAQYETSFGTINVSVFPTQVISEVSDSEGMIDLEYTMKIGGTEAFNRLFINYKAQ